MSAGDRIRRSAGADAAAAAPFRRPNGRASYPRRVTLDLDDRRYQFLKHAAWENRVSIAELLRAAIDLLGDEPALLDRAAQAAAGEAPGAPVAKSSPRTGRGSRR